jgi:hypothetical protein
MSSLSAAEELFVYAREFSTQFGRANVGDVNCG